MSNAPARIPAHDIEKAVIDRMLNWLQSPADVLAALRDETVAAPPEGFFARIIEQAATTAQNWRERIAEDRTQFLKNVIERVIIHSDYVEIRLRTPALVNEILGGSSIVVGLPQSLRSNAPSATSGRAAPCASLSAIPASQRMRVGRPFSKPSPAPAAGTSRSQQAKSAASSNWRHAWRLPLIHIHEAGPTHPRSIESFMTKPELMPISLVDLLTAIPMNWREQTLASSSNPHSKNEIFCTQTSQAACRLLGRFPKEITQRSSPDHPIAEESNLSGSIPHRKGTAAFANGEAPGRQRKWLSPEKALLFHYNRESCKFAGKLKGTEGLNFSSC